MKNYFCRIKFESILMVILIITVFLMPCGGVASGEKKEKYQKYTGKIYHIFFHSLIIDTKTAFSSPDKEKYNDWMTTRREFKEILNKLYSNGFILVDLTTLAEIDKNGTVTQKELFLPPDKKPLVISFDDVNYYQYMKGAGFAERLALDKNGNVTTVVIKDGKETYDSEGDAIPILDAFIASHPDFSPFGAKGIIAVTGFEGIFGYRITTLDGAAKLKNRAEAKAVAEKLKDTGWKIACHSYSHSIQFRDGSITLEALKKDTVKWKNTVSALIGETPIYVTPFGCFFPHKDSRLEYLVSEGFRFFCPVYKAMGIKYYKNFVVNCRLNFDGLTMRRYPERIEKYFFDPTLIIDPDRPY